MQFATIFAPKVLIVDLCSRTGNFRGHDIFNIVEVGLILGKHYVQKNNCYIVHVRVCQACVQQLRKFNS